MAALGPGPGDTQRSWRKRAETRDDDDDNTQAGSMDDEDEDRHHAYLTLPAIKRLIAADSLHLLLRTPSQDRLYNAWCADVRAQYGSVAAYMLQERLKWTPLPACGEDDGSQAPRFAVQSSTPYAHKDDYLVLRNDWPYGFAAEVTHICVWLKTPLPCDAETGAITAAGAQMTEEFVQRHIAQPLGLAASAVAWFKNPYGLQSIRFVDHVHVLLRDVDDARLDALLDWP